MDSYYPGELSKDTDWEEVEKIPLPSVPLQEAAVYKTTLHSTKDNSSATEGLKTASQENRDLMHRLSVTLRQNSFMESKTQSLEQFNQKMADKNSFLQDQFLILKEKYQNIKKNNSHFTENLLDSSQEVNNLKNNYSTLKTRLEVTEEERRRTFRLNRHLMQKLRDLLQQRKQMTETNTNLKNRISRTKEEKIQRLEKLINETKKNYFRALNQLNKRKTNQVVYYKNTARDLEKLFNNKQKQHLSHINGLLRQIDWLKKQTQESKWNRWKIQNKINKIKKLNVQLSQYLARIAQQKKELQDGNEGLSHLKEQNTKQQESILQYKNLLFNLKKQHEENINKIKGEREQELQRAGGSNPGD